MTGRLNMTAISAATIVGAAATGASYVYVDLSLQRMGASATAIGLNASMPALAWLLMSPLLPALLRRFDPGTVLRVVFAIAAITPAGFVLTADQGVWLALRFLFGGSLGLAFRLIEYWLNADSPEDRRARNVGLYASVYCAGAAAGAGLVPFTGTQGWPTILVIQALAAAALAVLFATRAAPSRVADVPGVPVTRLLASIGVMSALIIGLFDAVPSSLMPVYALRIGLSEGWAAGTYSAFLVGALLFPVIVGMLADRQGKPAVLAACTVMALAVPAVLPASESIPEALLFVMFVWGGATGSLYTVALAMLADHFRRADLVAANVAFGMLYAVGALVGPPLHGAAMDALDPRGLMVSSAVLFALFLAFMGWRRGREPVSP